MERKVKERIKSDPLMETIHGVLIERATEMLDERSCQYLIPDGRRLLGESRRALRHILYCGMAWRTTGDPRFRERAIRELDAAASLKDWNPSHFLDTAEMAAAVSLGYDWLFPTLTAEQRHRYEDALIQKSLKAVPLKYRKTPWWFREAKSNWSQVCAAGLSLAADAVKEREPELSARILADTSRLLKDCGKLYLPHGGYPEGPGYWHYGTNYHILGLAASRTMAHQLPVPPILERSGDFILQLNGPTGLNFNFADGHASKKMPTPAQSWIAGSFQNDHQAALIRRQLAGRLRGSSKLSAPPRTGSYFPLHLLWLPAPLKEDPAPALTDFFDGEQALAMARTGWGSDDAWLAIKGGTGAVSHGHLDAGSFVYEAGGVRWFYDLGPDNYNLPGYFHGDRWQYFRLQNHSHNTLVIDNQRQKAPAHGCPLTPWKNDEGFVTTSGDLSSAYAGQAKQVIRSAHFHPSDGMVVLKDEIDAATGPVRWGVVTAAEIEIKGRSVILTNRGRKLTLKRLDQEGGAWQEFSLKPPKAEENQNSGRKMIGFRVPQRDTLSLEVSWRLQK